MVPVESDRLLNHLKALTEDIGVRLAGMPGEEAAAAYIADEFTRAGAAVTREPFAVNARDVTEEHLEILVNDEWVSYPCSLFSNVPGTNGKTLEAELVFFEAPTEYQLPDLSAVLEGKAVVHLGSHIESREHYARLIAAKPSVLLMIDVRYPGDVPLADGMFPVYRRDVGAVPTLNVAYQDAWRWHQLGATRARWRVKGGMRPAESCNVIAELPGTEPQAEIIYVGAHHDTQADSVGADDNGSAVAGVLELARVLAPLPRRRTIRLISFGAEEQLSVGSAAYVRAHRAELAERRGFMFNLDSYGSRMGWTFIVSNGPAAMEDYLRNVFATHDECIKVTNEIVPYADHFPFVAAGVPGVWLGRNNCIGGRWFHHRAEDDITQICPQRMASLLNATAEVLDSLANAAKLPFDMAVPPHQANAVDAYWDDLFGGWQTPS